MANAIPLHDILNRKVSIRAYVNISVDEILIILPGQDLGIITSTISMYYRKYYWARHRGCHY